MKSSFAQFVTFNFEALSFKRPWFIPIPNFVESFDTKKVMLDNASNGRFVIYFTYETEGYDHNESVKNSNKYLELLPLRYQTKEINKKYTYIGKIIIFHANFPRDEVLLYGRIINNFSLNEDEVKPSR